MDYRSVENKFKRIRNPMNYFNGRGLLPFPPPENVLLFYRHSFETAGLGMQTDSHYRYVIIFNFGGSLKVFVDGVVVQLGNGEGLMILPFQYHRFINEGQRDLSLAFVTFSMEENIYFENLRNTTFPYRQDTLSLISSLVDAYFGNNPQAVPSYTALILTDIVSNKESTPLPIYGRTMSSSLAMQICKNVYADKSLTIKELSIALGYSESYLRSYFKKTLGLSLGRFIIEIRLTTAMRLLSRTDEQISAVADRCGYDSVFSFSRSFKKHVGISPTKYRYRVRILKETDDRFRFQVGNRE